MNVLWNDIMHFINFCEAWEMILQRRPFPLFTNFMEERDTSNEHFRVTNGMLEFNRLICST